MIEEFVYLLTELYTASNYKVNTGTRTHGQVNIERPILNWLVGTTEECLRNIITRDLLNSGFTARTCFIFGEYDFAKRRPRVRYPDDYEEVFHHLCCRLWMMQRTSGQFLMTEIAEAELDKWYVKRPAPDEELLYSAWKRQHDLLLKFAMILCLADGGPLVIQHAHIVQAKQMVAKCFKFAELLVNQAAETVETRPANDLMRYLQRKKEVSHTEASRYFRSTKGMNAVTLRAAVGALVTEGLVQQGRNANGGMMYRWVG